jgi:hypothetical protein
LRAWLAGPKGGPRPQGAKADQPQAANEAENIGLIASLIKISAEEEHAYCPNPGKKYLSFAWEKVRGSSWPERCGPSHLTPHNHRQYPNANQQQSSVGTRWHDRQHAGTE